MVRFPNAISTRSQNGRFAAGGSGYDPSSRYDPTTMGRIADSHLDPHLDPDEDLFVHANHSLGIGHVGLGLLGRGRGDGAGAGAGGSGGWGQNILCCPTLPHFESPKMRRVILFTLTATAVIGASFAIGLTVQRNADGGGGGIVLPSYGGGSSGSGSSSLSGTFTQPPAPPSDLASKICNEDAIGQPGQYTKCQARCTQAECCFLPEGHWFSCSLSSSSICQTYRNACSVLDEYDGDAMSPRPSGSIAEQQDTNTGANTSTNEVEVPPAPDGLDETCSSDNLATLEGHSACTEACAPARCCAEPIDVCRVSNPETCEGYTSCSVLLQDGRPSSSSSAAAGVKAVTPSSHPDVISSQAATKCNTASLMSSEGMHECQDFCEPSLCCFAPKGEQFTAGSTTFEGCAEASNAAWCSQYTSCGTLLQLQNDDGFRSHEDATSAVAEACQDSQSPSCDSICKAAECCFVDEDFCDNAGIGNVECDHYAACYELYDSRAGSTAEQVLVPRPPPDLETKCSNTSISSSPEARQMCADACSVAKCCVTDIETCKVVNPSMCGSYEVQCATIWNEEYQETTIPDPPADLETRCAGATIVDEKWEQCDDACRPARCCDEDISVWYVASS